MSNHNKRHGILTATLLALVLVAAHPPGAPSLKAVGERGTPNCGVSQGLLGFQVWTTRMHDWL
jgi:hypothetical protein